MGVGVNGNLIPPVKGEVRNPKGMPKGTKHLSTRIREMLTDINFEQKLKDGTVLKGEPLEAILKVAIAKARSGDNFAMEWLAKYGYGAKLDITTNDQDLFVQPRLVVEVIQSDKTPTQPQASLSEGTAE